LKQVLELWKFQPIMGIRAQLASSVLETYYQLLNAQWTTFPFIPLIKVNAQEVVGFIEIYL